MGGEGMGKVMDVGEIGASSQPSPAVGQGEREAMGVAAPCSRRPQGKAVVVSETSTSSTILNEPQEPSMAVFPRT